jgi:hypothetical protein
VEASRQAWCNENMNPEQGRSDAGRTGKRQGQYVWKHADVGVGRQASRCNRQRHACIKPVKKEVGLNIYTVQYIKTLLNVFYF